MKTLYLDLFSGISGDMLIAALIDLGAEPRHLEEELKKLRLDGYHLHVSRAQKGGLEGVKFDVHLADDHHHEAHSHAHGHTHSHEPAEAHEHGRNFTQIRQMITESRVSDWVKQKAVAVFQRIAVAEGKVHGLPPDQVSFHEVGAVDSIIDITGACLALEILGKPRVLASPVVEGTGWIDCAHGRLPIPAPATLAILGARGIALSQCAEPNELVTPTGAALLAELVEAFGPMQGIVAEKIGYGLGTRENETRPNVLRAVLGEARIEGHVSAAAMPTHDWETDTIAVLETNLDDINAEILGNFMEKALAAGALDVFHTPIQMKKNRPGVLLTVLCAEADADKFSVMLARDTSTFGIRRYTAERRKLQRDFVTVQTPHGSVTVKVGRLDGRVLQAAPEFESCRKLAEQAKVPLKEIYAAALRAFPPSLLK
jgi:pyridinium-3,5-bisthiocarboxylic acid mononucleotide nickel chelatase